MNDKNDKKGIFDSENYEQEMKELKALAEKIKEHTEQEKHSWKSMNLENS